MNLKTGFFRFAERIWRALGSGKVWRVISRLPLSPFPMKSRCPIPYIAAFGRMPVSPRGVMTYAGVSHARDLFGDGEGGENGGTW